MSHEGRKLKIEQTEQGRIALVGCETDKPTLSDTSAEITSLAQSVAQRLYDGFNTPLWLLTVSVF
jgi:hypothetical protein